MGAPVRLDPKFVETVWGTTELGPWFPDSANKVGEVWFPAGELLYKFLFSTERLSVQVHPAKTEMWYVLRAVQGARVALGFREPFPKERLREVSLSGEIEKLLDWKPVSKGDTFLVPTGTVHALTAGLVVAEVQQNAPVTYRLYDYGRPRELHLDEAIEVANCELHPGRATPVTLPGGGLRLATCEFFTTELYEWSSAHDYEPLPESHQLLIFLEGSGTIAGRHFAPGHVWLSPAGGAGFTVAPEGQVKLLRTYAPSR